MKYIIVIGDGMADLPVSELGGKTPLEYADIPVMDALARSGEAGTALTVPEGMPAGSDTAILSIFGCDPRMYYSGRSPLEAAGSGVALSDGDCSYRCNMISLSDDPGVGFSEKRILSHSGGSIDGPSSAALMRYLTENPRFAELASECGMSFYPADSFRHIAVQKNADTEGLRTAPPHDHLGETAGTWLPDGCDAAEGLRALMSLAHELLDDHPINAARRASGKLPANGIWFWAQGTAVTLPDFEASRGKKGFVVSAVPLVWGIGALAGMTSVRLPGATGELDTDYEGKADAVLRGLAGGCDLAVLHVEAPDECTHNGDVKGKVQAIERLDARCLAHLKDGLDGMGQPYRLLLISDHLTLSSTRGHDGSPVPYVIFDSRKTPPHSCAAAFTESECSKGPFTAAGHTLMDKLLESDQGRVT